MTLTALLLLPSLHAQACGCARNVALPSGAAWRPWEIIASAEYGVATSGFSDRWEGFLVEDRGGDSMPDMYMPPHLTQTVAGTATLGLPRGFAVSATVPWIDIHNVIDPEVTLPLMPGDVDVTSLQDVDATAHWARLFEPRGFFLGVDVGLTLPTGEVVKDSPVRAGRGVVGGRGMIQGAKKLGPRLGLLGSVTGATGFGPDETNYILGPNASASLGTRFTLRENGPLSLLLFDLLRWQGRDREEALVYSHTGYLSDDLVLGASWVAWSRHPRSLSFTLRGTVPLFQIVGDPMYAENFSASLGATLVAF